MFGADCEATLVFDRGNNSQDNIDLIGEPFSDDEFSYNMLEQVGNTDSDIKRAELCRPHYIGGIKRNQCPKLFNIPKASCKASDNPKLKGTTFITTSCELFGRTMTLVMTHNEKLLEGQMRGIENNLQESLDLWRFGIKKPGKSLHMTACRNE